MCAMCSSATIPPRSWWTGQLMAKVPMARMFTLEARQATSCAAARMDSGGTLSTIIKGRQCDSPPDICAPRQVSATEPLFSAPWGEARLGRLNLEMPSPPSTRSSDARERRSFAYVREDLGRARGCGLPVDHRRLLDRGDSSRPSFAYAIRLISCVMNVDARITEDLG